MEQIKILARKNSFNNDEHKTQLKRAVLSSSFFNKNNMKNNLVKRFLQLSLLTSLVVVVSVILLALNPQNSESKFSILVKAEDALEEAIQNSKFYYRKTKISENYNDQNYISFQETWGEVDGNNIRSIWYEENGYMNSEVTFYNGTEFSCAGDCVNEVERIQPFTYPDALIGDEVECNIADNIEMNMEKLSPCQQEIALSSILAEFFAAPHKNSLETKKQLIEAMKKSSLVSFIGERDFNNTESFVFEIKFSSKIKQVQKIYFGKNDYELIGIETDYYNGLTTKWELLDNQGSEVPFINLKDFLK